LNRNLTKDELELVLNMVVGDKNFPHTLLNVLWKHREDPLCARLHKAIEDEIISMQEGN